jgi:hypothetical protein
MYHKRSKSSPKNTSVLNFSGADSSRMEAEELLKEIDNLALLLHEVKKQTDRIEAAADAIGDAILSHLGNGRPPLANSRATRRSTLPIQPRTNERLRTMPTRTVELSDVQP